MDKQDRKKILVDLKQKEKERLVSVLPMPKELLKNFFDYLNEKLHEREGGHSYKLTEQFCKEKNIDFGNVKEWAADLGGYSDAEILWNVEQEYDFLF